MEENRKKERKVNSRVGNFLYYIYYFRLLMQKEGFVCFEGMSRGNEAGKFICQANEKQGCDVSYRFFLFYIIHTTNFLASRYRNDSMATTQRFIG